MNVQNKLHLVAKSTIHQPVWLQNSPLLPTAASLKGKRKWCTAGHTIPKKPYAKTLL